MLFKFGIWVWEVKDLVDLCGWLIDWMWLVWLEMLSNFILCLIDLCEVVDFVYGVGVWLVVDNIFSILYLMWFVEFGVDFVMYLVIKYFGGYGDVIGGVVVGDVVILFDLWLYGLWYVGVSFGLFEVYLLLCGMKMLLLWMEVYCVGVYFIVE